MYGLWLQAVLIGLTAREERMWKAWSADTAHYDSVLRSWGYWTARPYDGYVGPKFYLRALSWTGDTAGFLSPQLVKRWRGSPLTPALLHEIPHTLQQRLMERGFLFCQVKWSALRCDTAGVCWGELHILPGTQVKIDTILIRGKWIAPRSAFYQITGIRPGQPLRLSQWQNLPTRIRSSPYATLVDTPRLWLFPELAWIEVEVKPRTSNRIDGALSLLPATATSRTQIIGHLELVLLSPLRLGERIEARFAQLPGGSQRLNLLLAFPYLVRGFVEMRGGFSLWRQDTSFLTREGNIELRYRLTSALRLIGGFQTTTSRLINTLPYRERIWPPPPVLDFQRRSIRLGWDYELVDMRLAPRRGWHVTLIGTQGQRGYLRNPGLIKLSYERLPPPGPFQELSGMIERYIPVGRLLSIRLGGQGYRYLSQGVFENELPRVGGSGSLRGFPENTFPTAGYLHGLSELRLHIEEDGYIGAFAELTRIDLFGRGEENLQALGLLLQTRLAAGLFQITFAAGRTAGTPWDLRRALVRLEWISEF